LQPNKQIENSLIVETTAYIQINCNGTWHTIGFGPDKKRIDKKQTLITGYGPDGKPDIQGYVTEDNNRNIEIEEFKPASYYLERADKIRKQRGGKEGHSKHCSRCGFTGKNRLTCMSVIDQNGVVVQKEHRKTGGEW
jgi:hypothetical protein